MRQRSAPTRARVPATPWPTVALIGFLVTAVAASAGVASEAELLRFRKEGGVQSLLFDPAKVPIEVRSAWQATRGRMRCLAP